MMWLFGYKFEKNGVVPPSQLVTPPRIETAAVVREASGILPAGFFPFLL